METIIGGGVAALTMYAALKWNKSDREKIKHTFRNIGYTVDDKEPVLFKRQKMRTNVLYTYHVPFGLVYDEKLEVLNDVLNRPVNISFINQKLHIRVYKYKIPTSIYYNWSLTNGWTVPIGYTQDKEVLHDFDAIPHMTIAGMTRYGKTVLLKLLTAHLINNNPDNAEFTIIDLKGGLEFGKYENMRQMASVTSTPQEAQTALRNVSKSIKDNMSDFREKGYTNITETDKNKRHFIIVDEAAELVPPSGADKDEKKPYQYCQRTLSEIARIGGALGYCLIFCTQYPTADTLPREIKQNADAKITFRLPTEVASRVAIDENGAEQLENVGRAIYRSHDKKTVQVPYINDEQILERLGDYFVSPAAEERTETGEDTFEFG